MASFIMSAALPCIGAFMASLSPKAITILLDDFISGINLLLFKSVNTYPSSLALSMAPCKKSLIFGYLSKYIAIYSAASFLVIFKS